MPGKLCSLRLAEGTISLCLEEAEDGNKKGFVGQDRSRLAKPCGETCELCRWLQLTWGSCSAQHQITQWSVGISSCCYVSRIRPVALYSRSHKQDGGTSSELGRVQDWAKQGSVGSAGWGEPRLR